MRLVDHYMPGACRQARLPKRATEVDLLVAFMPFTSQSLHISKQSNTYCSSYSRRYTSNLIEKKICGNNDSNH